MKYQVFIKIVLLVLVVFFSTTSYTQTAIYNTGHMQLHGNAQIGFHTDVINDGILNNFTGFAGFYADTELRTISGANRITFFNVEVDALNGVELQNSLGIRNQLDFINGTIITPKDNPTIALDFIDYNFYAGEDNERHIDGYASIFQGSSTFTFPIGDENELRPMIIPEKNRFDFFKGAYFYEDPNIPNTFSTSFLTDQKQVILENISNQEFWDLDGKSETRITLTWNNRSDITAIANNISFLTVVGWSKTENQWVNLNTTDITGDLANGQITSAVFIPDNYEVITIGSIVNDVVNPEDKDTNNIIISPNGDTINDVLVFEEINEFTHNNLVILNRWGNVVYKTDDYQNNWGGISEGRETFKKDDELPTGTYFYVLKLGDSLDDLPKTKKGWVYITR